MGRPIDARGWVFEVLDQSHAHRERWLPIENLNSWSHNASENEETAETTSFDSKGWYEQDVMQRGGQIELEGTVRPRQGDRPTGRRAGVRRPPLGAAPRHRQPQPHSLAPRLTGHVGDLGVRRAGARGGKALPRPQGSVKFRDCVEGWGSGR